MADQKSEEIRLRRPAVDVKRREDGSFVLRSPHAPSTAPGDATAAAVAGLVLWPEGVAPTALVRAQGPAVEPVAALLAAHGAQVTQVSEGGGWLSGGGIEKSIIKTEAAIYVDTAEGLADLLPRLEKKKKLLAAFTRNLQLVISVDGRMPPAERARLAEVTGGTPVLALWGQAAVGRTLGVLPIDPESEGDVGLPLPGGYMKLEPQGGKLALSASAPGNPDPAEPADDAYSPTGLTVAFIDPMRPYRGLVLDA